MRILLTGATGFVGKALCRKLLDEGHSLRAAVWQGEPFPGLPNGVEAVTIGSIGPDTQWGEMFSGVDAVVHLAARVHVMKDTASDPLFAYREVNVRGTESLARAAAKAGVKRLVFLSSVKVHGEESSRRYTEADTLAPLDPYGVSKLEAEAVLAHVSGETGLETVVIRPPLVYGPGVKANFFKLLGAVAAGYPFPFASVKNARSMVYLGNLVDAIALCLRSPAAAGRAFLVSDGEDVSTPELIRRIAQAMGLAPRLWPLPPALMRLAGKVTGKAAAVDRLLGSLTVDSGRIRRELGWAPPFTMSQGLAETVAWYKGL